MRLWWLACAALTLACQPTPDRGRAESDSALHVARESVAAVDRAAPPQVRTSAIGFRTERLFREHYAKHGREFGRISADEYLRLAQALRDTVPGGDILEIERADGVISRFDRSSGSFLAFSKDLVIRTFFRPNDGEAYFRRQARRRPAR
jgi:pyocin large subunit-like protein